MADDTPETPQNPAADDNTAGPRIANLTQYVKDLSFENPNSPASILINSDTPTGELGIQVKVRKLRGDQYEVVLHFEIEGAKGDETAFLVELQYAGVFSVSGFNETDHQKALMVECPRLLFPFARRVIADIVRDGGFPPLMIGAIDFIQLYELFLSNKKELAEETPTNGEA